MCARWSKAIAISSRHQRSSKRPQKPFQLITRLLDGRHGYRLHTRLESAHAVRGAGLGDNGMLCPDQGRSPIHAEF
jgi:hypothetical protein